MDNKNIIWGIPVVILILALLPMPSGFYFLVRIVVSASCIYFLIKYMEVKNETMILIFVILTIIYNPFIPVYLYNKGLWFVINLFTIAVIYNSKDILEDKS